MRPRDREVAQRLDAAIGAFETYPLVGLTSAMRRTVLVEQLLESIHRVQYVARIRERPISPLRLDPHDALFDPLRAAILHHETGDVDEAFWLVFLFVHFGRHATAGWRYVREVYGRLGANDRWDWEHISADPRAFRVWLNLNYEHLTRRDMPRGFGNHRKYVSLSAYSANGTGAAFDSYVTWVLGGGGHETLVAREVTGSDGDSKVAFARLYNSMSAVRSFGRVARFDYLSMLGKLGFAPIEAGTTFLQGATGPLAGAQLLLGRHPTRELEDRLVKVGAHLDVSMQVLEDALCNWQKSPDVFRPFRG